MRRLKSSRPSPALVVAVVALVAALAGTAVAADPVAQTSINKKKTKKIAKKQAKKQANKAVDGFAAATFPIGGEDLASIEERTASETIAPSVAPAISTETATANCQTGERVISGGWTTELEQVGMDAKVALPFEDKRSDNGWQATAVNLSNTLTNELTAHAYCLAP